MVDLGEHLGHRHRWENLDCHPNRCGGILMNSLSAMTPQPGGLLAKLKSSLGTLYQMFPFVSTTSGGNGIALKPLPTTTGYLSQELDIFHAQNGNNNLVAFIKENSTSSPVI